MKKITLNEVEKISQDVAVEIASGKNEVTVFSPLETAVKQLTEQLKAEIKIPAVQEATDEELKKLKGYRTGIRKVLKFVEENRKQITRNLDELKKKFTGKEKEIVAGLLELEKELKEFVDNKIAYDQQQLIEEMVPERKKKVEEAGLEFTEEELKLSPEAFQTLYEERTAAKLRELQEAEEKRKREEEIRAQAKAEAKEELKEEVKEEVKEELKKETDDQPEWMNIIGDQEKDKLEKWKELNDFNEETDIIKQEGRKFTIYRKIDEIEL